MNTSYFNAIAGAFLAVVFVVMTVSIASDAIFHTREPVTEGFEIEVTEGAGAGGAEQEETGPLQIAPLMASASVEDGMNVFKKCASCHTPEEGGANKVGPNLWHILGNSVAHKEDFAYSPDMIAYSDGGETHWMYQNLSEFLTNPKKFMSGTKMSFAGLKKPEDRANVIAYLRSLSPDPLPLPEPEAASTETTPEATEASATPDAAATDTGAAEETSGSTDMTPAETETEKERASEVLDEAAKEGSVAVTTDTDALEEEAAEPTTTEPETSN